MSSPDDLPPLVFPAPEPAPMSVPLPPGQTMDASFLNMDLVQGVRYSLPVILAEIRAERVEGSFSLEKLDQKEIGKMFQNQKRRRAKTKK